MNRWISVLLGSALFLMIGSAQRAVGEEESRSQMSEEYQEASTEEVRVRLAPPEIILSWNGKRALGAVGYVIYRTTEGDSV